MPGGAFPLDHRECPSLEEVILSLHQAVWSRPKDRRVLTDIVNRSDQSHLHDPTSLRPL